MQDEDFIRSLLSVEQPTGEIALESHEIGVDYVANQHGQPGLLAGTRLDESVEEVFWPNTEIRDPDFLDIEQRAELGIASNATEGDGFYDYLFAQSPGAFLH